METLKRVKIKNFNSRKFTNYHMVPESEKDFEVEIECPFCGQRENSFLKDTDNRIHVCDCGECCAVMIYADGIAEISGFETR